MVFINQKNASGLQQLNTENNTLKYPFHYQPFAIDHPHLDGFKAKRFLPFLLPIPRP
jgi:hypothetical protein